MTSRRSDAVENRAFPSLVARRHFPGAQHAFASASSAENPAIGPPFIAHDQ